jgi:hypothetical protein
LPDGCHPSGFSPNLGSKSLSKKEAFAENGFLKETRFLKSQLNLIHLQFAKPPHKVDD